MEERKNFFSRFQIEYRRSHKLTKIVVIAAIVLSMTALITLRLVQSDLEARNRDLQAQAEALEKENAELEDKIDALGSVQSVEQIAQEELGLVDPDTVLIDPE